MLIRKKMKRIDLVREVGITSHALARMGKDEPVTMETLGKLCAGLDCKLEDIVEYIPNEK